MSADFHVDLNHEAVRQMLGGSSNGTGGPGTGVGVQENGLCSPAERKTGDCYLSLDMDHWLCFPKQVQRYYSSSMFYWCRSVKRKILLSRTLHFTCRLIRLSNALPAGHLLCDQPPHRHSDGGKSGKGADGKHCLWDRTLYQEYRLQQGQRVSLLWSFSLRLLDLLTSNTELNHLHCLIS